MDACLDEGPDQHRPVARSDARALCAIVAALSFAGCATSGDGAPGDATGAGADAGVADAAADGDAVSRATIDQACQANATGYCNHLQQCFPAAVRANWGDVAACIAAVAPSCKVVIAAPGNGWTADNLMTCIAAHENLACDAFLHGKPGPAACATKGAIADGNACRWGSQCASGYCRIVSGNCGTCVTPVARGGACTTYSDCASDLLCAKSGTCQPPAAIGATCDDTHPCALGAACLGGTCKTPGGPGDACDPMNGSADCDYYRWAYCDGTSKKCVAYAFAKDGQSCNVPNQQTVCEAGGGCLNGTCSAAGIAGTLCDPEKGITCASPLGCDHGVCKVIDGTECK